MSTKRDEAIDRAINAGLEFGKAMREFGEVAEATSRGIRMGLEAAAREDREPGTTTGCDGGCLAEQGRACAECVSRPVTGEAPPPVDVGPLDDEETRAVKELRERRHKRGAYWLSPEGRAEIRDSFEDAEDGNAVLPLLNELERLEQLKSVDVGPLRTLYREIEKAAGFGGGAYTPTGSLRWFADQLAAALRAAGIDPDGDGDAQPREYTIADQVFLACRTCSETHAVNPCPACGSRDLRVARQDDDGDAPEVVAERPAPAKGTVTRAIPAEIQLVIDRAAETELINDLEEAQAVAAIHRLAAGATVEQGE